MVRRAGWDGSESHHAVNGGPWHWDLFSSIYASSSVVGTSTLRVLEVDTKRSPSVPQDKLTNKPTHNKAYHQNDE